MNYYNGFKIVSSNETVKIKNILCKTPIRRKPLKPDVAYDLGLKG